MNSRTPGVRRTPRVVLAGDSAHSLHPMAGQGLKLSLGDVDLLADLVEEAVETGGDLGDASFLLER